MYITYPSISSVVKLWLAKVYIFTNLSDAYVSNKLFTRFLGDFMCSKILALTKFFIDPLLMESMSIAG